VRDRFGSDATGETLLNIYLWLTAKIRARLRTFSISRLDTFVLRRPNSIAVRENDNLFPFAHYWKISSGLTSIVNFWE
jgi:hypothetical protein